jgi:hypothetical protein
MWVLAKHINSLVKNRLDEATLFMETTTKEEGRNCYFRWLRTNSEMFTHFNMVIEDKIDNKWEGYEIPCKPGEDNVVSLFVTYLETFSLRFREQLFVVPEIEQYVQEICE